MKTWKICRDCLFLFLLFVICVNILSINRNIERIRDDIRDLDVKIDSIKDAQSPVLSAEEPVIQENVLVPEDTEVAKMRVVEWQTEEETQAMVEETCGNMWGEWNEWRCVLEDWTEINF